MQVNSDNVEKLEGAKRADKELIRQLEGRLPVLNEKRQWPDNPDELWNELKQAGVFDLGVVKKKWLDIDGEEREVLFMQAAETEMWPMGTNWWARDNALVANRLMQVEGSGLAGEQEFFRLGRDLLLSTLTIMSSCSQLDRIKNGQWPQIFLDARDNLNGQRYEEWSHKQDAWQMVVWSTLTALEKDWVSETDLTRKHKDFLGTVVNFLSEIKYWQCENSGSWEEIEALRTSVLAWDVAVLNTVRSLNERFNWLEKVEDDLIRLGCEVLARQVPFESPAYQKSNPRYREADMALIYLLQLETLELVADELGFDQNWTAEKKISLERQIDSLTDERTGGFRRYSGDSYQGLSFFRNETAFKLKELYGQPSGDASGEAHFVGRNMIVNSGREAAWVHSVWQMVAVKVGDANFRTWLERGLKQITSTGAVSVDQNENGKMQVINLKPDRLPEAYLTEISEEGAEIIFPSPHTPLNWAVGEAMFALATWKKSV